jgi:membrane dipeptidase
VCVDGHNDLALMIRFIYDNHIYDSNFTGPFENGGLPFHVDLPRLKAGSVGGAFWSAYVGCPKDAENFSDENYDGSKSEKGFFLDVDYREHIITCHYI